MVSWGAEDLAMTSQEDRAGLCVVALWAQWVLPAALPWQWLGVLTASFFERSRPGLLVAAAALPCTRGVTVCRLGGSTAFFAVTCLLLGPLLRTLSFLTCYDQFWHLHILLCFWW